MLYLYLYLHHLLPLPGCGWTEESQDTLRHLCSRLVSSLSSEICPDPQKNEEMGISILVRCNQL